jgi:hypothetical protein
VQVLNQQERLFQSQTKYATARYAYVNNILLLKQAAGTLSFDDLHAINRWLTNNEDDTAEYHYRSVHWTTPIIKPKPKQSVSANKKQTARLKAKHHKTVAMRHHRELKRTT